MNTRTRQQWVERITEAWESVRAGAVNGFLRTGHELLDAKEELEHGEWLQVIGSKHEAGELPFQKRVAQT